MMFLLFMVSNSDDTDRLTRGVAKAEHRCNSRMYTRSRLTLSLSTGSMISYTSTLEQQPNVNFQNFRKFVKKCRLGLGLRVLGLLGLGV